MRSCVCSRDEAKRPQAIYKVEATPSTQNETQNNRAGSPRGTLSLNPKPSMVEAMKRSTEATQHPSVGMFSLILRVTFLNRDYRTPAL